MPLLNRPSTGRAECAIPTSLLALGQKRKVASGAVLFQQGAPSESCFLLEKGEVALRRISPSGDEVELARIGDGDWFGEIILFAEQVFPSQALAVKESEVLEFRRASVLASPDPAIPAFFLSLLARKCLVLNRRIEELTIMDARERLARFIIGLCPGRAAGCTGGKTACSFPLPKKKREIAVELGMAPETLSRTLRQMEKEGLIAVIGPRLEIPSCSRLRALIVD
jgi:CRP/FNR family transcriptional regulator